DGADHHRRALRAKVHRLGPDRGGNQGMNTEDARGEQQHDGGSTPAAGRFMRAVVKVDSDRPDAIELRTVPVPKISRGVALVRVRAAGICGTDVHIARNEYGHEPPVTMGHEVLGTVESVGADGDAALVGRTVALETYYS